MAQPPRDVGIWLVVVLMLAVGAMVPWLASQGRSVALGALAVVMLRQARIVFGTVLLSPVQLVSWGLISLALLGKWLSAAVADAAGGASITLHLTTEENTRTQFLILVATVSILAGALATSAVVGPLRYGDTIPSRAAVSTKRARAFVLLADVLLAVMIISYTPSALLSRPDYIPNHVGPASLVAATSTALSFAAVSLLGYTWASRRLRWVSAVTILAYAVVFFGIGTRVLALVPILYAVGMFAARPTVKHRIYIGLGAVLSFSLVGLPLQLRGLPTHGIIPHFAGLSGIISSYHPLPDTAQNILISYPLIGATAFELKFPGKDLVVSLNPLPGGIAGWYHIAKSHRFNAYTPTAGLGELATAGWVITIIVCVAIGIAIGWLDHRSKHHMSQGRQILGLALVMCSGLFLLLFVQYNLRSAIRIVYYALTIDALSIIISHARQSLAHALTRR